MFGGKYDVKNGNLFFVNIIFSFTFFVSFVCSILSLINIDDMVYGSNKRGLGIIVYLLFFVILVFLCLD